MAAVQATDGGYSFLQVDSSGRLRTGDSTAAWTTTGFLTGDTVVKASAGLMSGVLVTATDAGGDIDVIVYDSPTSDLTGDNAVCRVTITTTTALSQASWGAPSQAGVDCPKGIYLDVVAGDCQVIVLYK
jgi:hypothetical protein